MPHLDLVALIVWTVTGAAALAAFYATALFTLHHQWKWQKAHLVSTVKFGKALYVIFPCLSLLLFHATGTAAHSLKEVNQAFEQEPIPPELMEVTKELDMTAGMRSLREQAHAKQHHLLKQYLRARTERMCTESLANIPRLDQEIVDLRDQGQHEEEQVERNVRDVTTDFIAETCTSPSMSTSGDLSKILQ